MSDNEHSEQGADHDASLLEGLYQLVLGGQTEGWEFKQLNAEVYERLQRTYAVAGVGSAGVSIRGKEMA